MGIRKAAVLVASLDQAAADLLLDQLPTVCADRVRRAVMDVDRIDPEERRRVIDEFRRIGPMIPNASPSGIDLTTLPVNIQPPKTGLKNPENADPANGMSIEEIVEEKESIPFSFLHQAEEEKLLRLLEGERPQTIALVLSHLPPEQAGEVLARFVPPMQIEVVRRLIDLQNADPATLREIEQTLESRFSQPIEAKPCRASGPDTVARILAACPGNVVGGILDQLAEHDEELAQRLGRRTIEFDELGRFDDATLLAVVRAAEPEVLEAALLGSPPLLVERILCLMAPNEAKSLRGRLNCPGPIRLSDVEDARQRIAALAQRTQYGKRSKKALAA
jgi:flagellar motor switch protein FliG